MKFRDCPPEFQGKLSSPVSAYLRLMERRITVFSGAPGLGKSHGACNAIYQLLSEGKLASAAYTTPRALKRAESEAIEKGGWHHAMEAAMSPDALLVDEVIEIGPGLRDIIFERAQNHRRTILITNHTREDFLASVDGATRDRIGNEARGLGLWITVSKRAEGEIGKSWEAKAPVVQEPPWLEDVRYIEAQFHRPDGTIWTWEGLGSLTQKIVQYVAERMPGEGLQHLVMKRPDIAEQMRKGAT